MTAIDPNLRTVQLTWDSDLLFHGGAEGTPSIPIDSGGKAGPGPMHDLLLAVGGCSGADVVSILKKMQVGLTRCDIEVSGRRAEVHPKRYLSISLAFRIAGAGLDETKARRAIELSLTKYCSVIHSLNPDIPVSYDLALGDP